MLNPNSSRSVTTAIESACSRSAISETLWAVAQLDAGPPAIETAEDVQRTSELVESYVQGIEYDIVIVACHSDPGVRNARRVSGRRAILGIGETSMMVAASIAERFGIISLSDSAAVRKRAMVARLGLTSRCSSVVPTGTTVLHGVSDDMDPRPYIDAAERAVSEGADALILGCAGMVTLPQVIEKAVGVPVIEPVVATLAVAASRLTTK